MPRQGRSGGGSRAPSAPSRPTVPQRAVAPPAQPQHRPASTAAHPPQQAQAPPQQSAGPGLFGQMASTAAGVAVGSSIGHAIGGFFGGGSAAPAEQQPVQAQAQQADQYSARTNGCGDQAVTFTKCLDENNGNMQICGWYLDQLKACQSAASQY